MHVSFDFLVPRVQEARVVLEPRDGAELDPLQFVLQITFVLSPDVDGGPVCTGFVDLVGKVLTIVRPRRLVPVYRRFASPFLDMRGLQE